MLLHDVLHLSNGASLMASPSFAPSYSTGAAAVYSCTLLFIPAPHLFLSRSLMFLHIIESERQLLTRAAPLHSISQHARLDLHVERRRSDVTMNSFECFLCRECLIRIRISQLWKSLLQSL